MRSALLLLALLALLAHADGLGNGFVYDDHRFVDDNPALVELGVGRALLDPSTHTADRDRDVYRPLRAIGHAFDLERWGPDPFGFHLHSIVVHVLCVLGAYLVLRRMLGEGEHLAAFGGAALLAVHPLGVEVVGWISSRGDEYALLFGLLGLAAAGSVLRAPVPSVALAASAAALAVLGKESAAVLPLLAWLAPRALPRDDAGGPSLLARWVLPGALAVGVAAALALRQVALEGLTPVQTGPHGGSFATQIVWAFFGLSRMLTHVVLPSGLSIEYEQSAWAVDGLAGAVPGAVVGALLALAPVALWRRARTPAFLLAWALLAYLPSSSLLVTLRTLVNDRGAYPCLVPLGALAGWALSRLRLRVAVRGRAFALGPIAGALLLALLLPVTWTRTDAFRSDATLWADVLARQPRSSRAWVGLAAAVSESDPASAGEALRRAVSVAVPGSKQEAAALVRLGDHVLRREDDPAAALPLLERALDAARRWRERAIPTTDELATAASLAEALTRLRRYDEAEAVLARTIAEEPAPALLFVKLGELRLVHAQQENEPARLADVWRALLEANRLDPEHPVVRERIDWAERNLPASMR